MTLSVAIAGCGYFSRFHQDAWSRMEGVRVVGVADRDEARRKAAAALFPDAQAFDEVEAMLDAARPDLIDIVTPPQTHRVLVEAAARRGVKMICQKPVAPGYDEAKAIVELAEKANVMLAVHENFRFMPWFIEAHQLIHGGAIGRPLNITFRLRPGDGQGPDAYLSRQPYFQSMPRFLIHETGIHLIDVFRYLLGEITGVFARLRRINPVIKGEDAALVIFDFASGAAGLFDGNRHVDHPADDSRMTNGVLLVEGDQGALRLDGYGRLFLRKLRGEEHEHPYTWQNRGYGGDCVYRQSKHIIEHLTQGAPLVNSGRDYLRNLAIEEAIYCSAQEDRFITL
jgi:predicted dehydrogenase